MAKIDVIRLRELAADPFVELVAESERAGLRFVRRLVEEWESGANRFDGPGEALFASQAAGRVVGVGGLNVDPYAADAGVGRVRRLYVLASFRRQGVGRRLLAEVIEAARSQFKSLRVRTESEPAAGFYEALGFRTCQGVPDCTHVLELAGGGSTRP